MDKEKKGREGERGVVPKKCVLEQKKGRKYKAILLMNNCVKLFDLVWFFECVMIR